MFSSKPKSNSPVVDKWLRERSILYKIKNKIKNMFCKSKHLKKDNLDNYVRYALGFMAGFVSYATILRIYYLIIE